mmetsp:Transcript_24785/g.34133  ORF Transcript_24785/g.34133 Transcript_24785/m.34133 type:complete len:1123 (-) Transcript_24785:45-3413(-)
MFRSSGDGDDSEFAKHNRTRSTSRGERFGGLLGKKKSSSANLKPKITVTHTPAEEDDISEELLKRLRETQRQLAAANDRIGTLEMAVGNLQDKHKSALAEIKKLNKVSGVIEASKFGHESRKELRARVAKAQEDLKELQANTDSRINQMSILLRESEKKSELARDTATRSLQQLQVLTNEEEEEVGYQHTLLQREYARQSVELNELREELAETRHLLEDQNSLLEQNEDVNHNNIKLFQQSVQISKAMLALFTTAQKEGVKFSPLLLGLVEQLQSLIHLTDEGRSRDSGSPHTLTVTQQSPMKSPRSFSSSKSPRNTSTPAFPIYKASLATEDDSITSLSESIDSSSTPVSPPSTPQGLVSGDEEGRRLRRSTSKSKKIQLRLKEKETKEKEKEKEESDEEREPFDVPRSLSFPKGYYGYTEILEVMVFEARGLPWFEVDPYVVCRLEEADATRMDSAHIHNALHTSLLSQCPFGGECGWNEVFVFGLDPDLEERSLTLSLEMFTVYKGLTEQDDFFLGSIDVRLLDLALGTPTFSWYSLTPPEPSEDSGLPTDLDLENRRHTVANHRKPRPSILPPVINLDKLNPKANFEKKLSHIKNIDLHVSLRLMRADRMVCSRPWFAETKQHIGPAQGWEKRGGEIKLKGEEPVGWLGTLSETVRTMTDVLVGERTDIGDLVLHSVEEKLTPLEQAVSRPKPDLAVIASLLQSSIDDQLFSPHFTSEGRGYLHFMAECGNLRLLKRLIVLGCKVRQFDDMGFAPIHVAAGGGHPMCLKMLLDEDEAMINLVDEETNSSPLHFAALFGRSRCVSLLLDRGARADQLDGGGASAFMKAAYNNHKPVLRLLSKGAKAGIQDKDGNTPFLISCLRGHFSCAAYIRKLLPNRSGLSSMSNLKGDTPIWGTIVHNNFNYLKTLLEEETGHKKTSEERLKVMLCSHTVGRFKHNLLHRCLLQLQDPQHCHNMVRHLLKCGADPNSLTADGKSPLFLAAFKNRVSCVPLLLQSGADVTMRDEEGNTALHFTQSPEIAVKILASLDDAVSVRSGFCNTQNDQGDTPLHVAFARADYEMATFLLSHGANPSIENKHDNRPEDCAWSRDVSFGIPFYMDDSNSGGGIEISQVNFSTEY